MMTWLPSLRSRSSLDPTKPLSRLLCFLTGPYAGGGEVEGLSLLCPRGFIDSGSSEPEGEMPALCFVKLAESAPVVDCISVAELGRGVMEGLGLGLDLSSFLARDSKTPPVTVSAEWSAVFRNGGSSERLESAARSPSDCFLALLFFFLLIVSVDPSPETKA